MEWHPYESSGVPFSCEISHEISSERVIMLFNRNLPTRCQKRYRFSRSDSFTWNFTWKWPSRAFVPIQKVGVVRQFSEVARPAGGLQFWQVWNTGSTVVKGVLCSFIWSDVCQISPGDGICTAHIRSGRPLDILGGTAVWHALLMQNNNNNWSLSWIFRNYSELP